MPSTRAGVKPQDREPLRIEDVEIAPFIAADTAGPSAAGLKRSGLVTEHKLVAFF